MKKEYNFLPYLFFLSLFGLLFVFSSSAVYSYYQYHSPYVMFFKQLDFFLIGFFIFFILKNLNMNKFFEIIGFFTILISILLLIYVLFKGITLNNAKRWVRFWGFTFQPSELFKLASLFIMVFLFNSKGYITIYKNHLNKRNLLLIFILILGLALIVFEPDFSTSALIVSVAISILTVSSVKFVKYTLPIIGVILLMAFIFIIISPYRRARVKAFNPFSKNGKTLSYQVMQSRTAIRDGKLFGRGLGKSKRKIFYLPQAYSDFIFAIIVEEIGLFGSFFLLFLYGGLLVKIYNIFMATTNIRDKLFIFGVFAFLLLEIIFNIGVNVGALPSTGLPLPLISLGGSSVIVFMTMLGIVASIGEKL